MQTVVTCYIPHAGGVVMICKPRRGWWVLPGGKVEPGERWTDAIRREVLEETGLSIAELTLRGVHVMEIRRPGSEGTTIRTLAQFVARQSTGNLLTNSAEGQIAIVPVGDVPYLPKDPGDEITIRHLMWAEQRTDTAVYFGKFVYDHNHVLLASSVEPNVALDS